MFGGCASASLIVLEIENINKHKCFVVSIKNFIKISLRSGSAILEIPVGFNQEKLVDFCKDSFQIVHKFEKTMILLDGTIKNMKRVYWV